MFVNLLHMKIKKSPVEGKVWERKKWGKRRKKVDIVESTTCKQLAKLV